MQPMKKWAVRGYDLLAALGSLFLAIYLHQDFKLHNIHNYYELAIIVLSSYFLAGYISRSSRLIMRFFSIPAAIRFLRFAIYAFVLSLVSVLALSLLSRTVLALLVMQSTFFIVAGLFARFSYRYWRESHVNKVDSTKRTLIVGAGQAASILLKDINGHQPAYLKPVALLDDDRNLKDRYLHGVPIVGNCAEIEHILEQYQVELVILAIPSLNNKTLVARINEVCFKKKVKLRRLPSLTDLVDGKVSVNALREVSVEDLLGRKPVTLDKQEIPRSIAGKCVLVTGGGGSIGSELACQIAFYQPSKLIILDHAEYNLYAIEQVLHEKFPALSQVMQLGSVTNEELVSDLMAVHQPELVFHAAAYKHVPLLESQPLAAMLNNIKGTLVVAQAALRFNVKNMVLISTDKAVNPTNVMGATKRVAELICQHCSQRRPTEFSIVRFGNVLNSVGSVIPRFRQQIKVGGPVTVTHPEITRYFMMIPEACQLILKAMQMSGNSQIFVLDMGEPIKIVDLAKNMIQLSGKELGRDIEIEYTGLRPGEKLYEELFHEQENLNQTQTDGVLITQSRELDWKEVSANIQALLLALKEKNEPAALRYLLELVPEARFTQTHCVEQADVQTTH